MILESIEFNSFSECHSAIGDFLYQFSNEQLSQKGFFSVALSGGRTPAALFNDLSSPPFKDLISWNKFKFFWGDERAVAENHPDSNFFLAQQNLFEKLSLPFNNIFKAPVEIEPLANAAKKYEEIIINEIPVKAGCQFPSFDLIMLGMGPDGHTASLFPGHQALLHEGMVADVVSDMANPPVPRLSFTLPMINNANTVIFMISGKDKLDLIKYFNKFPREAAAKFPAAMIKPLNRLIWYIVKET